MGKVTFGLLILGGLFLAIGVWMLATAYASKSWPVVDGLIEKSKVVGQRNRTGHVVSKSMVYNIQILYAYEVDGQTYRSQRYSLGTGYTVAGPFTQKNEARDWLKQSDFKVNQSIKVRVDPKDPENTVIHAGVLWSTWVPIILSILFIGTGLLYQYNLHKVTSQATI